MATNGRRHGERTTTVGEARAFLAALPKKGDRYLAMMVDGTEALENTAAVAEAMAASPKPVAHVLKRLEALVNHIGKATSRPSRMRRWHTRARSSPGAAPRPRSSLRAPCA